jgi:hypothetical protein
LKSDIADACLLDRPSKDEPGYLLVCFVLRGPDCPNGTVQLDDGVLGTLRIPPVKVLQRVLKGRYEGIDVVVGLTHFKPNVSNIFFITNVRIKIL